VSVFKKYISNQNGEEQNAQPSQAAAPQAPVTQQAPQPAAQPAQAAQAPISAPAPAANTAAARPSKNTSQIAAGSGRNMLSSDVEIKGRVKFANDLVVDGKIEGEIDSDGSLTVGENARVRAEIRTRSIVIYGKVHGNIIVTDRVELKANAELVGDIKAATLSIEAGAIFVGKSTVGAPTAAPTTKKSDKPASSSKKGKMAAAS